MWERSALTRCYLKRGDRYPAKFGGSQGVVAAGVPVPFRETQIRSMIAGFLREDLARASKAEGRFLQGWLLDSSCSPSGVVWLWRELRVRRMLVYFERRPQV